jgi:mannose-1-phosphate guanylyltransferase
VEIAGRPLLDYWFDALAKADIRDILINTHHLPEPVRRFIGAKDSQGFRAIEFFESELLGSAGTVAANPRWADDADDVLIVYADNLSDLDLEGFMAFHRSHGDDFTMLLFHAPNPKACGIAELDEVGRVIGFEEKPAVPKSDLANAGVYAVTAAAWREMAAMKAFDLGFDVLPKFVGRMKGYIHDGYHRDIGTIDALNAASREMALLAGQNGNLKGTGV